VKQVLGGPAQALDRILLGSVALLAVALIWVVNGTLEEHIVNAGDTAPKFSITTDAGRTVTRDNFGGKVLVLNFWATWCPPCIEELPTLNAFQSAYAKDGVVVLGVSIDRNEKLYRQFLDRSKLSFETARDPEANISASYGTFQIPETYIIDRNGKVVEKFISNQNWMDPAFLARIRRML
jgi:cytochrome c biogenesis protein CcmG/thiol:disulfide interchange protein DsbE